MCSMPCSIPTMFSCSIAAGRLVAAPGPDLRESDMARIDLVDLAHSYGGNDAPENHLR